MRFTAKGFIFSFRKMFKRHQRTGPNARKMAFVGYIKRIFSMYNSFRDAFVPIQIFDNGKTQKVRDTLSLTKKMTENRKNP